MERHPSKVGLRGVEKCGGGGGERGVERKESQIGRQLRLAVGKPRLPQEVQFVGPRYGLCAAGHVELAIDIVDVGLNRTDGNVEPFGDLPI